MLSPGAPWVAAGGSFFPSIPGSNLASAEAKSTTQSILRLDHIQPLGTHSDAYDLTPYRLSEGALLIVDEWISWLLTGKLEEGGSLDLVRRTLLGAS